MSDVKTAAKDFNLFDPQMQAEIYDFYAREQENGPIFRSELFGGYWVVIGHSELCQITRDWEHFSSAISGANNIYYDDGQPPYPPIQTDPPEQQEWRRVMNPFLSPGQADATEAVSRAIVTGLIDAFIAEGRGDLVKDLANPVPGLVFFNQVLQVPKQDLTQIRDWVDTGQYEAAANPTASMEANQKLAGYVYGLLQQRSAQEPVGDLIDVLFQVEIDGGKKPLIELVPVVMVMLGGGLETTSTAAGNAFLHLARNPELRKRLIEDSTLIPSAVEEFLRFEGSLHGMQRIVTNDVVVSGIQFKAGDKVLLSFAGANRDPRAFEEPEKCILDRTPNKHVAFGLGLHRCVGSNLARMNLRVMIEEVLRRLPDYEVDDASELELIGAYSRGYKSLPVTFTPGARLGAADGEVEASIGD